MMLKKDLTHQTMNEKTIAYRKSRRVIGLMKYELGGTIVTKFFALRPKTYSYLAGVDNITIKRTKGTKKCVIEGIFKSNVYENCSLNNEIILN